MIVRVKCVKSVDKMETLRVLYKKHDIIIITGQEVLKNGFITDSWGMVFSLFLGIFGEKNKA